MKILSDLPFSFLLFYVQETFIGTPRPPGRGPWNRDIYISLFLCIILLVESYKATDHTSKNSRPISKTKLSGQRAGRSGRDNGSQLTDKLRIFIQIH